MPLLPDRRTRHSRGAARHRLEALEARVLLHGTTIITHGWQSSGTFPNWLNTMASALVSRLGADTSVLKLTINANATSSISLVYGPLPTASSKAETILMIDWAAASGILSSPLYSTTQIATIVAPYLTTPLMANNIPLPPLAEGPMHFLGHSRGASLISELAKTLGSAGIWVDQLTTLDPYPVAGNNDPAVSLSANVLFADNYYQTSYFLINGSAVPGAFNAGPLSLAGGHEFLDGGDHADTHAFYHGTIDTSANASDGTVSPIPSTWYPTNSLNRTTTGFYYSRAVGGTRPLSGLSTDFGGNASRIAISATSTPWPNVSNLKIQGESLTFNAGETIPVSYFFQNLNVSSTARFFLDPDQNPYNGNEVSAGLQIDPITGVGVQTRTYALSTSLAQQGTYYLFVQSDNEAYTRDAYAPMPVFINAPSLVIGRHVFYNDSFFDGNNAAANAADDGAIAPDKFALLPDDSGRLGQYTSYDKGINGIIIDIAGVIGTITAADFIFKVGNDNAPESWASAPAPTSLLLRPGAGEGGSTRVHITWANNAIKNQWLQITMKANANTALASDEVFYFGNAVGETGDSESDARVNAVDEILTRFNAADLTALPAEEALANPYDFNRDGHVNAADVTIAGGAYTHFLNDLNFIQTPAPPFLPLAEAVPIQAGSSTAITSLAPAPLNLAISPTSLAPLTPVRHQRAAVHAVPVPRKSPVPSSALPRVEKVQTLHQPSSRPRKSGKGILFRLRHFATG